MEQYKNLELSLDKDKEIMWAYMNPIGLPCFSRDVLADIIAMQKNIYNSENPLPFKYFILASKTPGIYSWGGDLEFFLKCIKNKNLDLHRYGNNAVEAVYNNHISFNKNIITIALVQGDAFGGGFECALSLDCIVAERNAQFGFPEARFNCFPGMGAHNFLYRKVGRALAENIIASRKTFSGEEMRRLGVVDGLFEGEDGKKHIEHVLETTKEKYNFCYTGISINKKINPITLNELYTTVDIWSDSMMRLNEKDIIKIEKILARQKTRMADITKAKVDNTPESLSA